MQAVSRQPSNAGRARIAPLSVLPVFIDLSGKLAVVAGGSDAAAWKAELLLAAGARVRLLSPRDTLGHEMEQLAASHDNDALCRFYRAWQAEDLAGAAIAVADCESDAEAATFAAAAASAGVACNVIDKPEFCDFQFGSIVNRSPVVVGISTSGAAPVLGQALRRRIETLLPPSLAAWGARALRIRNAVTAKFETVALRRAFWGAFAERAFTDAPPANEAAMLERLSNEARHPHSNMGKVTFVGAGPGDAEHLTLKAMRALQAAEIILFDDLVSEEVLELARREAKRILVGKRAGRPSCRQGDINDMMVRLARAGRHVVRLKSGDPMIFGRGGEEMECLKAENIPYTVVPGITAASALASAFGVSLTHRDVARSIRFVSGHSKHGGVPADIDFDAIADPAATTIVYMAGRTAADIAARLMEHGMEPDTCTAVGVALGRSGERIAFCELRHLAREVKAFGLENPIVLGIGKVFDLAAAARLDSEADAHACVG
ncbi:siroheme synthase CysG [Aquamicrobium sp. LC103]|uniref:siroheme synthase CysG n=1 Tax=Aquamicrobium sp. LC103 TaxID=1120658 RepID=UPI00063E9FFC|nr:siroheme synthase CysG [Aquamicrobium sp. LC103]TKT75893.1 uroporphyrinogen-III C-methyltransferase [Aquamicrobium sp. LC103]